MHNRTQQELGMQESERLDASEITAQELGAQMTGSVQANEAEAMDALEQQQDQLLSQVREGIGELFEDGWTTAELAAMCCDETARAMIAKGASVARAACAYLKKSGGLRKGAVPTARMAAAGMQTQENAIERMTDEEFAAFAARANEAMKAGKKVRI